MILRPFFGYFGSKWGLAPLYPAPAHETIVEPFAGSAGYSLRHHRHRVILRDLDPVIVGIWRFLLGSSPADILRLPDVANGDDVEQLPICQEARWLIGMWLGSALKRPNRHPGSWMRERRWPDRFWSPAARVRIARQIEHVRHWRVEDGGYQDAPDLDATWFVDPPYEVAGKSYRMGSGAIDFGELARWSRARRGQVIVCENARATWLPFRPLVDARCVRLDRVSEEACWLGDDVQGQVTLQQKLVFGGAA